tara:strand:+ start:138 stop:548 length:411 start_codon:yes stop_codon:yes gene_type:complete
VQIVVSHVFDDFGGKFSLLEAGDVSLWIMEREWNGNRRNVSCVPRGEYELVRHHGTKYPNTWALKGLTVAGGAVPDRSKARFACVIHSAKHPTDLEGCLAPAEAISSHGQTINSRQATDSLLGILESAETHDLILD